MTVSRKPEIILVNDDLEVGGVQRIVVQFANMLVQANWRATVVAQGGGQLWEELDSEVRRRPVRPGRLHWKLQLALELQKELRRSPRSIIHSHQRGTSFVANLVAARGRAIPIEHVHNVIRPSRVTRGISYRSLNIVACDEEVAKNVASISRRPLSDIAVVTNGARDFGPRSSGRAASHLRICNVGRMSAQKDPIRFVRTIAALKSSASFEVSAVWVGDGPLRNECETLASSLGISSSIAFVGETNRVEDFVLESDLLLMTSVWEGLPLAALEAMSAGLLLVLPDVGGCAAAIPQGGGAAFAADASAHAIARIVANVWTSTDLEGSASINRDAFLKHFSLARMNSEMTELYSRAGLNLSTRTRN